MSRWVIEIDYNRRGVVGSIQAERPLLWDVMTPSQHEAWARERLTHRLGSRAAYQGWREVRR